jgi:hypothetical protein
MGSKAKIRFSAKIDDRDIELFNVRDLGDKGLVISSGYPRYFEHPDGKLVEFVDQHYSVHPTKGGADTTITQKTALKGDGVQAISIVAYIHNTSNHLLRPVYARRLPVMREPTRTLRARSKDTSRRIGKFNWDKATMIYSVFVSLPNLELPSHTDTASKRFTAMMGRYKLIVFVTYLNLPSITEGDVVGMSTSSEVRNGLRGDDHFQLQTESICVDQLLNINRVLQNQLRTKMLERLDKVFKSDRPNFRHILAMSKCFTKVPVVKHK